MSLVSARELTKTYPGNVTALHGLSFEISAGEVFGLLGPNGAGKSTTVRILATLSSPTSGSATVAGFEVLSQPERVRQSIGYVAQSPGLDWMATGRENLHFFGSLLDLAGTYLRPRIDELLSLFQLQEVVDRPVSSYSGGMRRRLDLAVGLLHHPKVLFLDEPTTGLDPPTRSLMWQLIRHLASEEGLAILLTTHYMDEADNLASRLLIIDRGSMVATGTPSELKGSLRGDYVAIQLDSTADLEGAKALLERQPEVSKVLADGSTLHVLVDDSGRAVSQLIGALKLQGVKIAQVTLNRPSLDDVYLSATGHKYQVGVPGGRFFPSW